MYVHPSYGAEYRQYITSLNCQGPGRLPLVTVQEPCFLDAGKLGGVSMIHNGGMTVRRLKTYTGSQGYVYQYYFVGKRAALADDPEAPATEFIFDVTSDRKVTYAVSVLVESAALEAWAEAHGRTPTEAEEYGAAKMRLFRAFDEIEDMMASGRELRVGVAELEEAFGALGVE